MAEALVFDFDGTLVDSITSIWAEYQRAVSAMGLPPITHRQFTREVGRAWDDIIRSFWPGLDPREFTRHYNQSAERMDAIPGVRDALDSLSGDYTLALMSSRGVRTLKPAMEKAGFGNSLFKRVWGRDDLRYNKPDPRALTQVCEGLGIRAGDAIYIGDSVIDARCALDAGCGFIAVLSGGGYPEDFRENGVEDIIASVADMPSLLQGRGE